MRISRILLAGGLSLGLLALAQGQDAKAPEKPVPPAPRKAKRVFTDDDYARWKEARPAEAPVPATPPLVSDAAVVVSDAAGEEATEGTPTPSTAAEGVGQLSAKELENEQSRLEEQVVALQARIDSEEDVAHRASLAQTLESVTIELKDVTEAKRKLAGAKPKAPAQAENAQEAAPPPQ